MSGPLASMVPAGRSAVLRASFGSMWRWERVEQEVVTKVCCDLGERWLQRISDAFQRSQSLGTNAYLYKIPASQFAAQASQATTGSGVRSAELPPLNRMPRAGEPALDRGPNMLMPQVSLVGGKQDELGLFVLARVALAAVMPWRWY